MSDTTYRRPPIVMPVILIGIGVLALMHNYGQLPGNFWQTILPLWPVLLVLIGVEILIGQLRVPWLVSLTLALIVIGGTIAGVTYLAWQAPEQIAPGAAEMRHIEKDLEGVTSASVRLSFGAGNLRVGALNTNHIMVGDFLAVDGQTQAQVSYSRVGARGDLRVDLPQSKVWPLLNSWRSNEWDVKLNSAIPLDLRIDAGASTNDLDLSDLKLSQLRVSAGVSTNTLRLPRTGRYAARISGGLATTTIFIPEGVAARIRVEGGLSTIVVDEVRFQRSGDEYVSPNYDSATDRVDLTIQGGLATVTVR